MKIDIAALAPVQAAIQAYLDALLQARKNIRESLRSFADGKRLKGDELTGWLGEIYAKILLNGRLEDDSNEHDFTVCATGKRYAVKARKGNNKGWRTTSAICKITGPGCPDALLFIHFNDNYEITAIWEYDWLEMVAEGRFKPKVVRGKERGWIFHVLPKEDINRCIYPAQGTR